MQQSLLVSKLAAAWPPESWRDVTVLVAVSGGADSVALVRGLHELRIAGEGRLVIAHYNHRLRGMESDGDRVFVAELAANLDLKFLTESSASSFQSSEAALRDERYDFLRRAADEVGARYVATAHDADDQVETVLHNILRGTGLTGLAGIARVRQFTPSAALIRPLLDVTRAEVVDYLNALEQPFREDSTNVQMQYTRNRIRHELLPLLEREFNPHVRQAIARLSRLAGEADDWIAGHVAIWADREVRSVAGGVEIDLTSLNTFGEAFFRELLIHVWRQQHWPLQHMSLEKWGELAAFARTAASDSRALEQRIFPGQVCAKTQGGVLRLTRPVQ